MRGSSPPVPRAWPAPGGGRARGAAPRTGNAGEKKMTPPPLTMTSGTFHQKFSTLFVQRRPSVSVGKRVKQNRVKLFLDFSRVRGLFLTGSGNTYTLQDLQDSPTGLREIKQRAMQNQNLVES